MQKWYKTGIWPYVNEKEIIFLQRFLEVIMKILFSISNAGAETIKIWMGRKSE